MLFFFENVAPVLDGNPAGRGLLPIPAQLVDELNEDIAGLVQALTGCGVTVLRPAAPGKDVDIRSPYWEARATPPLNVRDQTIILGNSIVETAPHVRARLFENDLLKPIFYRYYHGGGTNWLSMPRPALSAGSLDDAYFRRQGIDVSRATDAETAQPIDGLGLEMVFDGAQCIRLGRDVLVNVANRNHTLALRWLRDNLPQLRFHVLDAMADNHIGQHRGAATAGPDAAALAAVPALSADRDAVVGGHLPAAHVRARTGLQRYRVRHPHGQPLH